MLTRNVVGEERIDMTNLTHEIPVGDEQLPSGIHLVEYASCNIELHRDDVVQTLCDLAGIEAPAGLAALALTDGEVQDLADVIQEHVQLYFHDALKDALTDKWNKEGGFRERLGLLGIELDV